MIIPVKKNLSIDIGRDYIQSFDFYADAALTTPIDMTGYSLESQIRKYADQSSTLIVAFTCNWVDQATGKTQLVLTDVQTDAITYDKGYWDYKITDALGIIYTYFYGIVRFYERPTA